MTNLKPVDVAIIGGGWTGLTMAKELTGATGLSVVVLERGIPRKLADYSLGMDELDYAIRMRMMQSIADETITHRHSTRERAAPVRQYGSFLPGSGVGGAGEHWNGAAWRFLPDQFILRTHLKEKHGAAKLPEDLAVEDWGVTYEDLEPYYWRAEQMMGISGKAGNLGGRIVEGGNPFEGPRQHEYPLPPLRSSYLSTRYEAGAKKLGLHPYPQPAANLSAAYKNPDGISRAGCAYCGYCERFGCMVGAKAQPTNTLMPVLQHRKNFELRTNSWVRRIIHKDGKATGVQYTAANGDEFFQPAGLVIVSTFTLNNTRLLLLSGIGTPYDPATRKGTLGRNLTHQIENTTRLYFDEPLNSFMGTGSLAMRVSDFDGDHGLKGDEGILRFGMLSCQTSGSRPIATFDAFPRDETRKTWGSDWKAAALKWRDRTATIALSAEHLSYRQNYMDLDPTYTDKFGDPLLRFTLDFTEHEHKQHDFAAQTGARIARAMGVKYDEARPSTERYNVINYQSTHIQGGTPMGKSPESSVVNPHLQHWDMPNLFVMGASVFPQNPSQNPTLSVVAMTMRAADTIVKSYLKHPGKLA
ncbi:MAG: GMC family oxidoreductase [Bryobacteraceae bacterium]|jgi:gluconate 2-dehydrogenase alpha chain